MEKKYDCIIAWDNIATIAKNAAMQLRGWWIPLMYNKMTSESAGSQHKKWYVNDLSFL